MKQIGSRQNLFQIYAFNLHEEKIYNWRYLDNLLDHDDLDWNPVNQTA